MKDLPTLYQKRKKSFNSEAVLLRKRYSRYSLARLLLFLVASAIFILLFNFGWLAPVVFAMVFLILFYRFVLWHIGLQRQAKHAEKLAVINELELGSLDHQYQEFPPGQEYLIAEHPYAPDLDVFGKYSIYQYCCRATTLMGRNRLFQYLEAPAEIAVILFRQNALKELRDLLDWRQHLMAYGKGIKDDPNHLEQLSKWLQSKDYVLGNNWLSFLLYFGPVWFVAVLLAWAFYLPWQLAILLLLPIGALLKLSHSEVNRIHSHTAHAAGMIAHYAQVIQHIESVEFTSPELQQLQQNFGMAPNKVSRELQKLDYIIRQLNVRYNFFAVFLNISLLWDLQWVFRLEKWKAKHKGNLPRWFESMGEFETLSSFANLWHNNPSWRLPEFTETQELKAVSIGHPLIHHSKSIRNDLSMPVRGHIKLITGSNMAGKSTFLRIIGINAVLAQAGAPVCATHFTLPALQVITSMRTMDALHENTSSFYAELRRLKVIINAVKEANTGKTVSRPVFFLLDEILKGTNSVDRHTGSKALIKQLLGLLGGGLIATHDLELGKLEATSNGAIENLCMEVEVVNGDLLFDYKLKKGISQSFNATLLMQQMGIEVEEKTLQART